MIFRAVGTEQPKIFATSFVPRKVFSSLCCISIFLFNFFVSIRLSGNVHYAHDNDADNAADKQSYYKSNHVVILSKKNNRGADTSNISTPIFCSDTLTDDLIASFSHSRTGQQREQFFILNDV